MKLSNSDLGELANIAIQAATEAGQMIAAARADSGGPANVEHKDGQVSLASQVVTEIDRRSEDLILGILTPTLERFELGLLTEEQVDDSSRLTADYFWCIDPLDGTLPFIEGVPGYAVSIALVQRDGTPRIGVIYDPAEATILHAISGMGVFQNGQPWPSDHQQSRSELTVFADRSFRKMKNHAAVVEALDQIASELSLAGVRVHETFGAVKNACDVLTSAPACYFKFPKPAGGGSLWDFAATACLFQEAGAVASDVSGDPLDLNRSDSTFMNHRGVLFATDPTLADRIQALYGRLCLG